MTLLRASITIPTYNRREILLQTLASLDRQSVSADRYEVIVGVDGSRDGTVEALEQLQTRYQLRWLFQENRGAVAAANAATALAQHDVLIVLGDDQDASPDLIAAHLEAHERHGNVLVQGDYPLAPGHARNGASLVYERSRRAVMCSLEAGGTAFWHLWGGNFSVRLATWKQAGGWDEAFRGYGGEDTDLGYRVAALGVPFIFEPRARSYHLHAASPRALSRNAFSEGRSVVRVARKHRVPLDVFAGTSIRGPIDAGLQWGWRRIPGAMHAFGHVLTGALRVADLAGVAPAQIKAARIVRRFYRIGGITRELLAT